MIWWSINLIAWFDLATIFCQFFLSICWLNSNSIIVSNLKILLPDYIMSSLSLMCSSMQITMAFISVMIWFIFPTEYEILCQVCSSPIWFLCTCKDSNLLYCNKGGIILEWVVASLTITSQLGKVEVVP